MSSDSPNSRDMILDSLTEGVFTVDPELTIQTFNKAAEEITGLDRSQAIGMKCYQVFQGDMCRERCALSKSMRTGRPSLDQRVKIRNAKGRVVPISIRTSVLKDPAGRVIGGVETFRDMSTEEALRKELTGAYSLGDLVGKSRAMRDIFAILPDVAESESTVLIQGESGSGKEILARTIHNMSPRAEGPFLPVNCAALPDTLLESELFGYVKGAFTDARSDRPGRFEAAQTGTLFLDEIGEISPAVQVKLLRVLDERAYVPLGSNQPRPADVRLLAATNRDLQEEVRCGRFRSDLFYRLNIIRIDLPPLRERPEDIPLLVESLLKKLRARTGKDIRGLTAEAAAALMAHPFPGNVRQLENALEHGFVLCRESLIDLEHLPADFRQSSAASTTGPPETEGLLAKTEHQLIVEALARHDGKRKAAAEELGISTTTLWRRMKAYGLL